MSPPKTKAHVGGTCFVGYLRISMCEKKDVTCHRNRCREDAETHTQAEAITGNVALRRTEQERFKMTINQKGLETFE